MNIDKIIVFNGKDIQYGLIVSNKQSILVNINNPWKPLQTLNFDITSNYENQFFIVVFDSFINIFIKKNENQECIKIDTRSFDFKEIKILLNGQSIQEDFRTQQGNIYLINHDLKRDLYVIDINQQLKNLETFNYQKLFYCNLDYDVDLINFSDNTIYTETNKFENYNLFIRNKNNNSLNMLDKTGTLKLELKDYQKINIFDTYLYMFLIKENNKVNLINLSKSVFNDKPNIFSKDITNKQFLNSYFFIQINNNFTYSIVIYSKNNSLLEIIILDKNLNQDKAFKIENVKNFKFNWLDENKQTLQFSLRPVIFIFQNDCYYLTIPNEKNILLWKNEELIKKYENNWNVINNFSPFLLEIKNIPIIVTKNNFLINDKEYENKTIFSLKEGLSNLINIKNEKILIENFGEGKVSIIYLNQSTKAKWLILNHSQR